jgi:ubiquinone/menaquinone biosynthesis C-methylase UbiE
MSTELSFEIEIDKLRKRFSKYTKLAFELLPRIENPHILDIGCGSGIPTIMLAKLSNGKITGIDIDDYLLDRLEKRIQEEGLSNQVVTKKCSLFDIDFPNETFDIVWAEGSIWIIGFKKGLEEWRRLLKPEGFLVVHDSVKTVTNEVDMPSKLGYELINHFQLPEDAWLKAYCVPLERLIKEQLKKVTDAKTLKMLERYQNEVIIIRSNPKDNISAFYIMQKTKED